MHEGRGERGNVTRGEGRGERMGEWRGERITVHTKIIKPIVGGFCWRRFAGRSEKG